MKLIKLHLVFDDKEIYVNPNKIITVQHVFLISPTKDETGEYPRIEYNIVKLDTDGGKMELDVKESPEDINELIEKYNR